MNKLFSILLPLMMISGFGFCESAKQSTDTQGILETIDSHVLAIREGNLAKAYAYASRDYRRNTSFVEFQELVKLVPVLNNNKNVNMQSLGEKDGVWIYCGTMTANSGEVYSVEYYLIRENQRWRIMGMYLLERNVSHHS